MKCNLATDELLDNIIEIIESETKPGSKRLDNKSEAWRKVDAMRDKLDLEKEVDIDSNLKDFAKTL
jgi:hypothetical protein